MFMKAKPSRLELMSHLDYTERRHRELERDANVDFQLQLRAKNDYLIAKARLERYAREETPSLRYEGKAVHDAAASMKRHQASADAYTPGGHYDAFAEARREEIEENNRVTFAAARGEKRE